MKRGMGPVIGAVLLVMLTMVIGTMVFLWAKNTIKTSEEEALKERLCESANFVIGDFCYEDVIIENIETGDSELKRHIKFSGRNEAAEPELDGFMMFIDYDGRTVSISSLMYSEIEGFKSKRITTDFIEDTSGIKQIKVVPKIKKDRNIFICEKQGIEVMWEDVKEC